MDAAGYWLDTSEEAIQWRRREFELRRLEKDRARRFDIESTIREWAAWCGDSQWTRALRRFHEMGGQCEYWCGRPHSHSAIPLTFTLYDRNGVKLPCNYRLKDIRAAIAHLEAIP
jgi:hypothetical protein